MAESFSLLLFLPGPPQNVGGTQELIHSVGIQTWIACKSNHPIDTPLGRATSNRELFIHHSATWRSRDTERQAVAAEVVISIFWSW